MLQYENLEKLEELLVDGLGEDPEIMRIMENPQTEEEKKLLKDIEIINTIREAQGRAIFSRAEPGPETIKNERRELRRFQIEDGLPKSE